MPNWVFNSLSIDGDKEQIQKVKAQLNAPYQRNFEDGAQTYSNPIIAFWNIVRPPEDKMEEYEGVHGYTDGERKGDGAFNWYNFNNREWGTKWDIGVADSNKYSDTEMTNDSETNLGYRFQTAWSPPIEALENLSSQYPELEITLDWEEEQGFGGVYVFQDGEHSIEKEWDIPDSHADYEERDNVDGCVCNNSEDVDDWYDDCPGAKKVIELTCVKDVEVVKSAH